MVKKKRMDKAPLRILCSLWCFSTFEKYKNTALVLFYHSEATGMLTRHLPIYPHSCDNLENSFNNKL